MDGFHLFKRFKPQTSGDILPISSDHGWMYVNIFGVLAALGASLCAG